MRLIDHPHPLARGLLAWLAASVVAFTSISLQDMVRWWSPSYPPPRIDIWLLLGTLTLFALAAMLLGIWLVPTYVAMRWLAARRHIAWRARSAVIAGIALFGGATLYLLPAAFSGPPTWDSILGKLPVAIEGVLFVLTWFASYEWLSRRAAHHAPHSPSLVPILHPAT